MSTQQTFDVTEYIDGRKINAFNVTVVVVSFLVILVDGFDITVIALAIPHLIREWGVQNPGAFGWVLSASLFGMLFGAPLIGHFGDRYGRKTAILVSYAIFGVFTLCAAWSSSINQLAALRFLAGIGIGGLLPNIVALNAEFAPRRVQAAAVSMSFAGITLGGSLPGAVAAYLVPHYGWQILFYLGGIVPLLFLGIIATWLPESLRFLALKGRQAEVAALMQKMDPGVTVPTDVRFIVRESETLPFTYLFEGKLAVMTPLLWLLFALNLMGYYFLISWMPTLLASGNIPVSQAALATTVLQVGGFVGAIGIALPLDRRGMLPIVALFVCAVPIVGAIGFTAQQSALYMMMLVGVAGFCTLGAQFGLNAVSAIIYPTALRSTGSGWAFGIGRVGSIVGPIVGGVLIGMKLPVQQLYMMATIPFILAAIIALIMMPMYAKRVKPG
jgi:AAHS family 4-hydroxybenzoate transporter-like MFS transporter